MARLRYIGGGFIPKVPARDLMADEVKKYGLTKLLASGLYEDLYPPKPAKAKKKKKKPEPLKYEEEVDLLSDELDKIDEIFEDKTEIEEG